MSFHILLIWRSTSFTVAKLIWIVNHDPRCRRLRPGYKLEHFPSWRRQGINFERVFPLVNLAQVDVYWSMWIGRQACVPWRRHAGGGLPLGTRHAPPPSSNEPIGAWPCFIRWCFCRLLREKYWREQPPALHVYDLSTRFHERRLYTGRPRCRPCFATWWRIRVWRVEKPFPQATNSQRNAPPEPSKACAADGATCGAKSTSSAPPSDHARH